MSYIYIYIYIYIYNNIPECVSCPKAIRVILGQNIFLFSNEAKHLYLSIPILILTQLGLRPIIYQNALFIFTWGPICYILFIMIQS